MRALSTGDTALPRQEPIRPKRIQPSPRRLDLTRLSCPRKPAKREGGQRISSVQDIGAGANASVASLLFAPGRRPGAEQVRALADSDPSFVVSLEPDAAEETLPGAARTVRWIELLANGLTFDLEGLAPGDPLALPPRGHVYGLPAEVQDQPLEAIRLRPGPHIAAGGRMLPVLRQMAWLAARLAALPGVQVVAWHAARTWCGPGHFRESVIRWIEGGAFPGLGLTALVPAQDGCLQSEGLALFTGQELRIDAALASDRAAAARLALRLLHWLVDNGRLDEPVHLAGPGGEPLLLAPTTNGHFVGVWRE